MIFKIISSVIYVIILLGLVLIFIDDFERLYRRIKNKLYLKRKLDNNEYVNRYIIDLENAIRIVFSGRRITVNSILIICILLFVFVSALLFPLLSIKAFLPSICAGALPLIFIKFRLESLRNKGSREAEKLISNLLNYYRSNHKNIFQAMEMLIKDETKGYEITKRLMFQLLIELRGTKSAKDIKRSTEKFAFGINTNWSFMLSQCIFASAWEGSDVTEAMSDILEQLKIARTLNEEKKRINAESSRMVKFIVPFAYIGSMAISVVSMDISLNKVLSNQFTDSFGLQLLFGIILLFVINTMILNFIKNGKFDF